MSLFCAGPTVDDYAGRKPALDLRDFFNGDIEAEGVFFNRKGLIEKQFHVAMKGSWQGNNLSLIHI